jgi:signal peptide peptidase SppA
MNKLNHLSTLILNTPLLCTPDYAETLCAVLSERIGVTGEGMYQQDKDASQRTPLEVTEGTRVIPIVGSMTHRSTGIEAMSGMTSYADLQRQVEEAMSDTSVKNILLDIDSGGGQVAGAFDFRDYLMAQRGRKPIISMARDTMASAAYLIGSATDKIYTTQTGSVGSIGVVAMHVDNSEANAKAGVKPTFIYAGDYKVAGNPNAPLEGEALSYLQESVNDSYEMFISAVAEARDIKPDAVRATEARMYRGQKAVDQGLADGVSTLDLALTELATSAPRVYQSMSITNKENLMTPEEIEKLQADLAVATTANETLRASVMAEGYSITAEGLSKEDAIVAEFIDVYGTMVDKATLPEAVVTALETAFADKLDATLTEQANRDLPNFAMDDAKALLKLVGSDEATMTALKAADAAMGKMMAETGSTDLDGQMTTAQEKLDVLIANEITDAGLTGPKSKVRAKAMTKVLNTAEGKALEVQARTEKGNV